MRLFLLLLLLCLGTYAHAAKQVIFAGHFGNKAVLILDGQQRILEVNGAVIQGVRLLAVTSDQAQVEINGKRRTLVPYGAVGSISQSGSEYLSVKVEPDAQGMYFIDGKVNGKATRFIVDTGASLVAMSSHEANRLGIDYRSLGQVSVAQTASGIVKTWNLPLQSINISGIEVKNVGASVIEGRYPTDILLGMSFLRRIKMENNGRVMVLIQK